VIRLGAALLAATLMGAGTAAAEEPVRLYAAGSLREALTEVASAFEQALGGRVAGTFGPSGLLRDRIDRGEPADLFASANMEHPASLSQAGKAAPAVMFARNRLCALVRPGLAVTPETLLDRMLDPALRLGTSTPKADPSGDYAWAVFEKAEALRPGSYARLDAKALKLTGGPASAPPLADRSIYGLLVESGEADIFLTYCTNAALAQSDVPALGIVQLPESLAVGAAYGLTVIAGSPPQAATLAFYILSPDGQRILARHGFATLTPSVAGK